MDQPVPDQPAPPAALLQTGKVLGQSHSFSLMAGRCSAAQAETLLRIREGRLYLHCASSWKEFCPQHLHISSSQADRIIRVWQQHGPAIFELKQLIRISSEDFRAVEPFIKENALHFNDEAIELDPENAEKIAGAVDEICSNLPPKEKPAVTPLYGATIPDRVSTLEKMCQTIVFEFRHLADEDVGREVRYNLGLTLKCVTDALHHVNSQHGLYPSDSHE
ncbi:conserved hypothetical protein [Candidatus Sulfopaludibacter sp. SbA4]|nr:conserved hypothetical protein [Candidatus Sulfopaludibacter sp. SbA4]